MEQFIRNQTRGRGFGRTKRTRSNLLSRRWKRLFVRRRKRVTRYGLLAANVCLLVMVVLFVAKTPSQTGEASTQKNAITSQDTETTAVAPLDDVSSADIAVNVARTVGLPETVSITNQADSISLTSSQVKASTAVVTKPQVVATALPSKDDIRGYIVKDGDTISSIAAKMGVTSDSIRWSNGLTGEYVAAGTQILIPPSGVNGIVYTVVAGDTPATLAARFNTDKDLIISFNDAELHGLQVGERILIPDGSVQPVSVAPTTTYRPQTTGFAWGGNLPIYGSNGYDYGYCTYYVATRIHMPANWGNADTWPSGARASGWTVSTVPRKGGIAWGAPIIMHVAYVEDVKQENGQYYVKYSDMNNLAGWNAVGYSDWVPASYFPSYIYP